jgi:hypothetical protein
MQIRSMLVDTSQSGKRLAQPPKDVLFIDTASLAKAMSLDDHVVCHCLMDVFMDLVNCCTV